MKNGNPMMWSQCRCDMKTWNRWPFGPPVASTLLPSTRAPLPRSHSTYSGPPVSICTQEELPPKVCETENASSSSTKARALPGVSSPRPAAATSAVTSLRFTSAEVMATGIEPRVPQKRTSMPRGSGGPEGGERLRGERGERLVQGGEDLEDQVEAADREDLAHHRLEPAHRERAALPLRLLGGEHEYAQAHAADVLHPAHVDHHAVPALCARGQVGGERGLELLRGRMVDAPLRKEDNGVGEAPRDQLHVHDSGGDSITMDTCGTLGPRA